MSHFSRITKIFVINNGKPFSPEELRIISIPKVECLQVNCRNKSLALNAAIGEIQDPDAWIIFLDDDVTASVELLEEYLRNFAHH